MDDNGIRIRSARTDEIPHIRELLIRCSLPSEDVTASAPIDFSIAVTREQSVVGCVGLTLLAPAGLLRSLAVAQNVRGMQIGHALIAAAEAQAQRQGVADLYLLTTTASQLFAGLGYSVVERGVVPESLRRGSQFTTLCPASAVCMHKATGPTSPQVLLANARL